MVDKCLYWYEGKKECTRMTNILQLEGVVGYHASMTNQTRSCEGILMGCYFTSGKSK